ncbi:hypothetical protein ACFQI7_03020 [Paenibacillus allorhizosphaerae]|uniref:Uncharacterized protein n=1 Tax=Paenibacillus allorhizosphaerae TaxID=2849866 RepID=A0ABN7TBU2_9BACL|nr:hypothetical protein [Paenibacillus allorhizosphaerae]CAG7618895.1 hypothetical protein PAECIP111802_00563 [Paenibacillus allorhizosphaerae]
MAAINGLRANIRHEMEQVLAEFVPVLQSWTDNDTRRLIDPFETVYSENYAPANAAVIYASIYRSSGNPEHLHGCLTMVRRSAELLRIRTGISPFCRVFLYHYSMMALLLLPDEARSGISGEFSEFYACYEDDCKQLNTNCAALQWGTELYLQSLGFRGADVSKLEHLLHYVEQAQAPGGFINDEVTHSGTLDGMPIAYHAFTLFILFSSVVAVADRWPEQLETYRTRSLAIIGRGLKWLTYCTTEDGTYAMIERSSHQMFTWGVYVALLSGSTAAESSALFRHAWEYWLNFRHEDGSYGCTPNWLPHGLRTGFESYTHVNMYNNLGLTGIAVALKVLEAPKVWRDKLPPVQVSSECAYIDEDSGYAFYRKGAHYFACSLRMHNRKYAPALQGFHYRLSGCRLPLAEPRFKVIDADNRQFLAEGAWEGFLLKDESGTLHFPDSTDNANAQFTDTGVELVLDTVQYRCTKHISAVENGFSWRYRLELKQAITDCWHVLPLIVHDGRNGTKVVEKSASRMDVAYQGQSFSITYSRSSQIGMQLHRTLLSVSGAAANVHAVITGPYEAGAVLEWETRLQVQREQEGGGGNEGIIRI